jgi:isopentenyl diphosphate isomerase/L-lactate dehydrogenase-like FMN-dependent dehydrogenase
LISVISTLVTPLGLALAGGCAVDDESVAARLSGRPEQRHVGLAGNVPGGRLADDVAKLKGWSGLPVLVKGIVRPDDAEHVVADGVDGLIVSNH